MVAASSEVNTVTQINPSPAGRPGGHSGTGGGHPHQCQGAPALVALGCTRTGITTTTLTPIPQEEGCEGCWWDLEVFWV